MDLGVLLCAVCSYCAIASCGEVNITDDETLKRYLCLEETLPFNSRLVLSKSKFILHHDSEGSLYCLVENMTGLSILPSHDLLSSSINYVTISCDAWEIGIGFFNITNLTISSVVFEGCVGSGGIPAAAVRYINESGNYFRYSNNVITSLLFNHCYNLKLYNVSVMQAQTRIPGFDIIGVNLCGETIIETLLPTAYNKNATVYPSLTMLIYFTDSNITSTLSKCNLNITSNIVHSGYQSIPFSPSDSMWITTPPSDFTLFTTQQHFDVFANLNIGHHNESKQYPTGVLIGFVNSITSSRISFQGYNLQYLCCAAEDNPVLPSLQLLIVFFETSSFLNRSEDVLSPLVIKNTSFSQHFSLPNSDGLENSGFAILRIIKFTGKLSHEIVFRDVAWCKNDLAEYYAHSLKFYYMYAFHAQNMFQAVSSSLYGHLYLNFNNVIMHHNTFSADESLHRSTHVLMSFDNLQGVTMTGTSYFADNKGGTAINIESSNLTISGNLTVKDGQANEGGGIHINEASTLFLKEPLWAYFYNNTAIKGSAIYAPVRTHYHDNKISAVQIWPNKKYSFHNVTSIRISVHFEGNGNGHIPRSFYAPHLSFFGKQTSPNFSFNADTWDRNRSQYAYTTLIDTIFHMEERDKYTSLSNGLCVQFNEQQWKCRYIDLSVVNSSFHMQPQCENQMLYSQPIFPGQQAFSILNDDDNQFYDIGYCYPNYTDHFSFEVYKYWNFSMQNYTQDFTFFYNVMNGTFDVYPENAFLVALYSDIDTNALSVPILQLNNDSTTILPYRI